jgi:hypothetical protein
MEDYPKTKGPERIITLRRLVTAISNFRAVIEACGMLLELNVDSDAPYFRIFTAGIVVSYMRPFTRADGLGPLSAEYAEFPKDSPDLKVLHELLEKGRHWVFAHDSAKDSPSLLSPEKRGAANEIIINFYDNGVPSGYRFNTIQWERDRLHAIIDLCEFQWHRIDPTAVELILDLAGDKLYRAIKYWARPSREFGLAGFAIVKASFRNWSLDHDKKKLVASRSATRGV